MTPTPSQDGKLRFSVQVPFRIGYDDLLWAMTYRRVFDNIIAKKSDLIPAVKRLISTVEDYHKEDERWAWLKSMSNLEGGHPDDVGNLERWFPELVP